MIRDVKILLTIHPLSKSRLYHMKHSLFIGAYERERKEREEIEHTYTYYIGVTPSRTSQITLSHYPVMHTWHLPDYLLLRNTNEYVFHPFQRREKEENHRKRKREYVNEKECPIAIVTVYLLNAKAFKRPNKLRLECSFVIWLYFAKILTNAVQFDYMFN